MDSLLVKSLFLISAYILAVCQVDVWFILSGWAFLDSVAPILALWVPSHSIPIFSRFAHWNCQWPPFVIEGPLSSTVMLTQSEGQQQYQPTVAGKGSCCPKSHLHSFPCSPLSPLAQTTDWIPALISLQASTCSWNRNSVLLSELLERISTSQPWAEPMVWVVSAAPWQALILSAPQ